jgi:hypothetical protein
MRKISTRGTSEREERKEGILIHDHESHRTDDDAAAAAGRRRSRRKRTDCKEVFHHLLRFPA